jgi:hypothetical protein
MKQNRFPPGWDEDRVQRVLAHYETQAGTEAVAEDEAVYESSDHALVSLLGGDRVLTLRSGDVWDAAPAGS